MSLFSKNKNVKPEEKEKKTSSKKETKLKVEKTNTKDLHKETAVEPDDKNKENPNSKAKSSQAYRILVKPLVTEKASNLNLLNKYAFEVYTHANKIEVAQVIEDIYKVKPTGVNIIRMKGKKVTRGKYTGKRKDWKKAIVTLPKGKTIQVYEGI